MPRCDTTVYHAYHGGLKILHSDEKYTFAASFAPGMSNLVQRTRFGTSRYSEQSGATSECTQRWSLAGTGGVASFTVLKLSRCPPRRLQEVAQHRTAVLPPHGAASPLAPLSAAVGRQPPPTTRTSTHPRSEAHPLSPEGIAAADRRAICKERDNPTPLFATS